MPGVCGARFRAHIHALIVCRFHIRVERISEARKEHIALQPHEPM